MPAPVQHRIIACRLPHIRAWLDAARPEIEAVRAALPTLAARSNTFETIPSHNRMNRIWRLRLEGIPGELILKQGWNNPVYPWHRRLCRHVRLATSHPFLHSMALAFEADALGFHTVRPLAYWKQHIGGTRFEPFILYPLEPADDSLDRHTRPRLGTDVPVFHSLPSETCRAFGRLLRRLHDAGIVHMDPAPKNILIRSGAANPPREEDLIFIDVDAFRRLPGRPGDLCNRLARARSLHRLLHVFDPSDFRLFCEAYAAPDVPDRWTALFDYVRLHSQIQHHLLGLLRTALRS